MLYIKTSLKTIFGAIPYNGIQGFPTNYNLRKFFELHADITGTMPYLLYVGHFKEKNGRCNSDT